MGHWEAARQEPAPAADLCQLASITAVQCPLIGKGAELMGSGVSKAGQEENRCWQTVLGSRWCPEVMDTGCWSIAPAAPQLQLRVLTLWLSVPP